MLLAYITTHSGLLVGESNIVHSEHTQSWAGLSVVGSRAGGLIECSVIPEVGGGPVFIQFDGSGH